jgi:hypothetical protein
MPRHNHHFPVQDHKEVVSLVAFSKQHLARLYAPPLTVPGESFYLRVTEPRKRSVAVGRLSELYLPACVRSGHYPDNPEVTTFSMVVVSLTSVGQSIRLESTFSAEVFRDSSYTTALMTFCASYRFSCTHPV